MIEWKQSELLELLELYHFEAEDTSVSKENFPPSALRLAQRTVRRSVRDTSVAKATSRSCVVFLETAARVVVLTSGSRFEAPRTVDRRHAALCS